MSHRDVHAEEKQKIRQLAQARRRTQPDKDQFSRKIVETALSLAEVQAARTLLFYVDVRDEVRTRHALPDALSSDRRIIVPWCGDAGELKLFHLEDLSELEAGRYGILEPRPELCERPGKRLPPGELDAVLVPGVAFDKTGSRLGHGKGYYDRLLNRIRPDCSLIGLAFECQLFETIPMSEHDVRMDLVVTEQSGTSDHIAK